MMLQRPVNPLFAGVPYIATLPASLYRSDLIDFVEVTPESVCRQRAYGNTSLIEIVPDQLKRARDTCGHLPLTVHGVELSIGSAHGCNEAYLDMLEQFQNEWPFLWHSEHLGFQTIRGDNDEVLETGVPLPLPLTTEAADLVATRSSAIQQRFGTPFLLENPAHYLTDLPSDPEIGDDGGFLRAITERSGCFQLLDLHNVYCNSINLGWNAFTAIERMPLDRVVEIHVAGGEWRDGFWMDAHNGRVPERVWELLAYTLPRARNVAGIVFEVLDEYAAGLGQQLIEEELLRVREIWERPRWR